MGDINQMITELHQKLVLQPAKTESKPRKVSLRQYFIWSYVKEGIYRDFTPFEMTSDSINGVANLAAQITFKLITWKQKEEITKAYEAMTDEQLEHLKNL